MVDEVVVLAAGIAGDLEPVLRSAFCVVVVIDNNNR